MTANWLTFQSFQHNQEVVRAINTLSVHLKLISRGGVDSERSEVAVNQSVAVLQAFLDELGTAADQADRADLAPVVGVDPRLEQLAQSYLAARRRRRFRSRLSSDSINEIKVLLGSRSRNDQQALAECLAELRVLVEEHMHEDINAILGAI